jgi:hypothetical protein
VERVFVAMLAHARLGMARPSSLVVAGPSGRLGMAGPSSLVLAEPSLRLGVGLRPRRSPRLVALIDIAQRGSPTRAAGFGSATADD